MARKQKPVRVERGLYRSGSTYLACATPPGSRTVRWKTLGVIGLMEARAERDAWVTLVRGGKAAKIDRRTVADVAEMWLAHLKARVESEALRQRTYDSYESGYRLHIKPVYGGRELRSLVVEDFVEWHHKQRLLGAAKWSIRARWMAWRSLVAFAVRKGFRDSNPTDALLPEERPKPGDSSVRFLTREEIPLLLGAAEDDEDRDLIATGIFTGMRASEILGVTLDDIDNAEEIVRVRYQMSRQGKRVLLKTRAARRDVVLMAALGGMLKRRRLRMKRSSGSDLLFQSATGKTMGYWSLQGRFEAAAQRAGLTDVTPHTMRHTFAAILISEGRSVEFVSQQLGHAHTSTTLDTYSHLFDAARHAQEAREGLEANFGAMLTGTKQGLSA
jgi:integrase